MQNVMSGIKNTSSMQTLYYARGKKPRRYINLHNITSGPENTSPVRTLEEKEKWDREEKGTPIES